jgi:hypothetical protein
VASSELIERVAHRYGFHWLIATNKRHSLYRIHLMNAVFFSVIIMLTMGSQEELANMYALGLVASFCINMGSLIIYRYFKGTAEGMTYITSRLGTLILWIILVSCFVFLAIDKTHATMLWASVTGLVMLGGFLVARKRGPEIKQLGLADSHMDLILHLAEADAPELQVIFRRPQEEALARVGAGEAYISFFVPRMGTPLKLAPHHFRFPLSRAGLFSDMVSLLKIVAYELADRKITVQVGWPMSSWLDRLAIGVMVFNLMRLPRLFPQFEFTMRYPRKAVDSSS